MNQPKELDRDRPVFEAGEVVTSEDGAFAFSIIEFIGEGRCCVVYSCQGLHKDAKFALKFFKRGVFYEGAVQREQYILDTLGSEPENNIVTCFGFFKYRELSVQVMELLDSNIRQIIFKNDRQGLSPWLIQKFARDILRSLKALHSQSFIHADLKPANVMWSTLHGKFKLLDFGLTFHTEEQDLHPIQSSGYRAPEVTVWINNHENRRKKKRKLEIKNAEVQKQRDSSVVKKYPHKRTSVDKQINSKSSSPCLTDPRNEAVETCQFGESDSKSLLQSSKPSVCCPEKNEFLPYKPKQPCDVWSFGCLLVEILTGQKLFCDAEKTALFKQPKDLLPKHLAATKLKYTKINKLHIFFDVLDLIQKCLTESPLSRISSEEALNHNFLNLTNLEPNLRDMVLLPSQVLRLIDIVDLTVSLTEAEDLVNDIRQQVEKYGQVAEVCRDGKHVYVEFCLPEHCQIALRSISKLTFNDKKVVATYYPLCLWRQKKFVSPELS